MLRIVVMPMIGEVSNDRLGSLRGCHAIHERRVVKMAEPGEVDRKISEALKELALADRHAALSGKLRFIVSVDLMN